MTLQANELRIGNCLRRCDNDYWIPEIKGEIFSIDIDELIEIATGNETEDFTLYEPVLLSPEIFEKCGFVKQSDSLGYSTLEDGHFPVYSFKSVDIINIHGEFYLWEECHDDHYQNYRKVKIDYLHSLQNLTFALTQQELPITF